MRKKKVWLSLAIIAIALTALVAVPALAAWIGSVWVETEVQEPITYSLGPEEVPDTIFPGETFSFSKEIDNKADVPYGMSYGGWLYWSYYDGMGAAPSPGEEKPVEEGKQEIEINLSEVGEELELSAGAGGLIGRIIFTLDPDGDGPLAPQPYRAGEVVNISPNGEHILGVSVELASDVSPGHLRVEIYTTRGNPA